MLLQALFLWIVVCCLPLSLPLHILASPSPQPETTPGPRPDDEATALKDRDAVPAPSRVVYDDISTIRLPDSRITCVITRAILEDYMNLIDVRETLDAAVVQANMKPQAQKLKEDEKWKVKGRKKKAQFSIYCLDQGIFTWSNVVELVRGLRNQYFVGELQETYSVTYITYNSQGLRTTLGKVKKTGWFGNNGGLGNGTVGENQTQADGDEEDDDDDYFNADEVASLQRIMASSGDPGNATTLLQSMGDLAPHFTSAGNYSDSSSSNLTLKGPIGDYLNAPEQLPHGPLISVSVSNIPQPSFRPHLTPVMSGENPSGTNAVQVS